MKNWTQSGLFPLDLLGKDRVRGVADEVGQVGGHHTGGGLRKSG